MKNQSYKFCQSNQYLPTFNCINFQVLDCQGSCDNSQLVSCSMDKSVVLWDVTSGNFTRKWRGHQVSTYLSCTYASFITPISFDDHVSYRKVIFYFSRKIDACLL